jgi:hypothetical protein
MASGGGWRGGGGWLPQRWQHTCAHIPSPPPTLPTTTAHSLSRPSLTRTQAGDAAGCRATRPVFSAAARRAHGPHRGAAQVAAQAGGALPTDGDAALVMMHACRREQGEKKREGGGRQVPQAWQHRLRTQPPCPRARLAVQASRSTARGPARPHRWHHALVQHGARTRATTEQRCHTRSVRPAQRLLPPACHG